MMQKLERRTFLKQLAAGVSLPILLAACGGVNALPAAVGAANSGATTGSAGAASHGGEGGPGVTAISKPLDEWRKLLPADSYNILFEEGTEQPFTSPLLEEHREGTFVCMACNLPLFSSKAKYDSGTGWPSFYESLPNAVGTKSDFSLIEERTEYHCLRCGGHQGHVFDDGPEPTGKRYCNNGVAIVFVPKDQTLPALRT